VPARQARTVTAVVASVLDARRTILELALDFGELPVGASVGGLRGGTMSMTKAGARLSRFAYVHGVQVSGLIPTSLLLRNSGAPAELTVGGSAASGGTLRLRSGGRASGVLGGRPFRANVSATVRVARAGAVTARRGPLPDGAPTFPLPGLARLP